MIEVGLGNAYISMSRTRRLLYINVAKFIGINFFDTAQLYGNAEAILGSVLKSDELIVTKIGLSKSVGKNQTSQKRWNYFFPPENLESELNESLSRLNRKKCYGLLLHAISGDFDFTSHIKVLNNLKQLGKVEYIGFSVDVDNYLLDDSSWADIIEVHVSFLDTIKVNKDQILIVNGVFRESNERKFLNFAKSNADIRIILLLGTHRITRLLWQTVKFKILARILV